jgi:hypothetical protein
MHRNKNCPTVLGEAIRERRTFDAPKSLTFKNEKNLISPTVHKKNHQSESHWANAHRLIVASANSAKSTARQAGMGSHPSVAETSRSLGLNVLQRTAGVSKFRVLKTHPLHETQIKTAQLAVFIRLCTVVEHTSGFDRAA